MDIATDAAADVADDQVDSSGHEDRIAQLEREMEALSNLVEAQGNVIDNQRDQIDSLRSEYEVHTHY